MSDTSTLISALENAVLPLDFIYRARADESCFEISGHLFNLKLDAHFLLFSHFTSNPSGVSVLQAPCSRRCR
jgi:hypothetical protein